MVTVRTDASWDADLLPSLLMESGARAVLEEGEGVFTAPFEPPADPDRAAVELRSALVAESGLAELDLTWRWQPHEDWESLWRRGLQPRRVTDRLVITPTWDTPERRPGDLVVTLDPGMAFGTAEHATTRGCLRLLDGTVSAGDRVADIGAGSAILSVAAALLGAATVLAVESDPYAVEAARENVVRNQVSDRVSVEERLVDVPWLQETGPGDGIVANIERGVVVPLLPGLRTALRPGGWLILSGIQDFEAPAVRSAAEAEGFIFVREDREDGWWSSLFRRPDPLPAEGPSGRPRPPRG
jgi:ribosomal protein L11 methyltransferase